MKQSIIKMTQEKWIEMSKLMMAGDEIHVFDDNLSGEVIEYCSADNTLPDTSHFVDYLDPVHTFRYLGRGQGLTVEADPKGTKYHMWDEYKDRVMQGNTRLIVTRHKDFTSDDLVKMTEEIEHNQIDKPYGWGAIIGFGLYRLVRDTPIGSFVRWAKWQTPWCSRQSPVCSQGSRLDEDCIIRYYNILIKLSNWQDNTPQRRLEETLKVMDIVIDSFEFATK